MRRHWIGRAFTLLALAGLTVVVFSGVVMSLWNWLMPAIFGSRLITFWQALGLLVLARILFGRLGGEGRRMHWRHRMKERWNQMTPEEREKFGGGMRGRCRGFGPAGTAPTSTTT
jgi:hypothetical protein